MPFWLQSSPGRSFARRKRNGETWHMKANCQYWSTQHEHGVLKTLLNLLQQKMLGMKGSLSDDEQTLKSQDLCCPNFVDLFGLHEMC